MLAPASGGVLVASPSPQLHEQVVERYPDHCLQVQYVAGGAEALVRLESGDWQVLFLDRHLPDLDAEELVPIIQRRHPGVEVVMLDSRDGPATPGCPAVALDRRLPPGGTPLPPLEEHGGGAERMPALRLVKAGAEPLAGMVGESEAMQRLYRLVRLVAPRTTTVLLTGATGTGKELVARAIHGLSPRAARSFVAVNCAAIPEALLEAELFGHARGAFTGAVQASAGRIQAAQGGSLFLDEIGDLPLSLQAKLLRFLDQKEIQRLGGRETARVDVRVVAATNAHLPRLVGQGKFRADLYYRLTAFPLELPPLAERVGDILPLAEHFLRLIAAAANTAVPGLSREAIAALHSRIWEGNVRELQQVMERAAILVDGGPTILPEHLWLAASENSASEAKTRGWREF